jgi:hypothetical protein
MPLFYIPFRMEEHSDPEILEAVQDGQEEPAETADTLTGQEEKTESRGYEAGNGTDGDADVIEEREGVHFISQAVLDAGSDTAANLNQAFKDLVDSVIN